MTPALGWLDAIAEHLAAAGLATYRPAAPYQPADGWPLFVEQRPPDPDEVVVVTGYGGDPGGLHPEPPLQVVTRSLDVRASRHQAEAIEQHLTEPRGGVDLPGGWRLVQAPSVNGAVTHLGLDDRDRHQHVTNHALTLERH